VHLFCIKKYESCYLCVLSSDDDIDVVLRGSAEQQRRLKRRDSGQSSSEDEFEKEMASELNAKMKNIKKRWIKGLHVIYRSVQFLSTITTMF